VAFLLENQNYFKQPSLQIVTFGSPKTTFLLDEF